ncbi:MAG: hypothetical protein ACLVIY_05945 [Anaerobutyricum soehngenii]
MDMDMKFFRKLPVPKDLKREQFPADEKNCKRDYSGRDPEVRRNFEGSLIRPLINYRDHVLLIERMPFLIM